jgi:hypothetical protein
VALVLIVNCGGYCSPFLGAELEVKLLIICLTSFQLSSASYDGHFISFVDFEP